MNNQNGGPAFPQEIKRRSMLGFEAGEEYMPGMTLRDYFAAKALAGLCAKPGGPFQANSMSGWSIVNCSVTDVARECYGLADAMIAAREA